MCVCVYIYIYIYIYNVYIYIYILCVCACVERNDHAELKRHLRKGNVSVLPNALYSWKCEPCDRMLHSKAFYINHNKIHVVGRGGREAEAEEKQISTLNFV